MIGLFPLFCILGLVALRIFGAGNDGSHFLNIGYQSLSFDLEQDVSLCRGFFGSCQHGNLQAVGDLLVQYVVEAAAADDVHFFHGERRHFLEHVQYFPITQGQ